MNKYSYRFYLNSLVLIGNLILFAGIACLVAFQHWSAWWFLIILIFNFSIKKSKCKKCGYTEEEDNQ